MEEQINQIIQKLAQAMQGDEEAQQLAASLVQAVQQQDESAMQVLQAIQQQAEAGDQTAQAAAAAVQAVAEQMQGGAPQGAPEAATMARLGAKLNYINYLRGKCPQGYEMQMFKKGGAICKKCVKKKESGGNMSQPSGNSTIDAFRCGRKMKKKAEGGTMEKKKKEYILQK